MTHQITIHRERDLSWAVFLDTGRTEYDGIYIGRGATLEEAIHDAQETLDSASRTVFAFREKSANDPPMPLFGQRKIRVRHEQT